MAGPTSSAVVLPVGEPCSRRRRHRRRGRAGGAGRGLDARAAADRSAAPGRRPACSRLLLLVQAVLAVVAMAGGDTPAETATFARLPGRRGAGAGRRRARGRGPSAPGGPAPCSRCAAAVVARHGLAAAAALGGHRCVRAAGRPGARPPDGRGPRTGGSGPGRVLVAVYAIFALAAGARAAVQLSTKFAEAPVAYLLSALAAVVYIVATVGLVRGGRGGRRLALGRDQRRTGRRPRRGHAVADRPGGLPGRDGLVGLRPRATASCRSSCRCSGLLLLRRSGQKSPPPKSPPSSRPRSRRRRSRRRRRRRSRHPGRPP